MITKQQVRAVLNAIVNGNPPPLNSLPAVEVTTLFDLGIWLHNLGYNVVDYFKLVEDYLDVKFIDLPDTVDEVKLSYIDILNAL